MKERTNERSNEGRKKGRKERRKDYKKRRGRVTNVIDMTKRDRENKNQKIIFLAMN